MRAEIFFEDADRERFFDIPRRRTRKIAIYLSKTICRQSNLEIGKYFGIGAQAVTINRIRKSI